MELFFSFLAKQQRRHFFRVIPTIAPSRPGERFLFPRKDSDVILPVKYLLELCRLCVKKISLLEETLFQQGSEFNPTIILENI